MALTGEQIGSAIKTFAKVGAALVAQIALYTVIGIIVNLIFVLFLTPEMGICLHCKMDVIKLMAILISFLVLFPVIYFFIGKGQGVKAAISKIIYEKGDVMIGYVVAKFTDKMANAKDFTPGMEKNGISNAVKKIFPGFIRTLNGLPWILKLPMGRIFEAVDFAGEIERAYATRPDAPINSIETNQYITSNMSAKLKAKFQPPKGKLLLGVVALNLLIFIMIKLFM